MILDAGVGCDVGGGVALLLGLSFGRLQLYEVIFDELENDLGMREFLEIKALVGEAESHLLYGFDLAEDLGLLRVNW